MTKSRKVSFGGSATKNPKKVRVSHLDSSTWRTVKDMEAYLKSVMFDSHEEAAPVPCPYGCCFATKRKSNMQSHLEHIHFRETESQQETYAAPSPAPPVNFDFFFFEPMAPADTDAVQIQALQEYQEFLNNADAFMEGAQFNLDMDFSSPQGDLVN